MENAMNLFLYIIWSTAYFKKKEIIEDIDKAFKIYKTVEIVWSKNKFAENLSRFYGQKLPQNSFKEKACGIAPFTVVIFEDEDPKYEMRKTSRGKEEWVNSRVFDKKMLYREWTYPKEDRIHSRIHGTNTYEETKHDLTLLLGMGPEDFVAEKTNIPDKIQRDIVGATGWKSLEQLFYILNQTCEYVVLRNFEGLPGSFHVGSHEDIDLLVSKFEDVLGVMNARRVNREKYRVQCAVEVCKQQVLFDLRYVGDSYYCTKWEKHILENRRLQNGVYVPMIEEYKYMLLYHALIHKRAIAEDYIERLSDMFGENLWNIDVLNDYLKINKYNYVEPLDYSVFFNAKIINYKTSIRRKIISNYRYLKFGVKKVLGMVHCW